MTGRILEKYSARNGASNGATDAQISDLGEVDDLGCFGWLRGIRERSLSLELRKLNGNIVAVPYHAIERFDFDPSEGIALAVGGQKILLKGRNLNTEIRPAIRLYEGITRHRVSWVREASDREHASLSEMGTVVDSIEW